MNSYSDAKMQIGTRIREIRIKRNITQEVLAEKAGISNPQQMSNIERGYSGVSVERLMDICNILDISADYILFGRKENENELDKLTAKMSLKQKEYLNEIISVYAKVCGIYEE